MSINNYILNLLNIKDKNIYILTNKDNYKKIKNKTYKIIEGILTYKPDYCPCCGIINNSFNDIIKWGFKRNCKVKIPNISNCKSLLFLHKQRFYCKHCCNTFIAETNLIDRNKNISNNTELQIRLELMKKQSEKNIADRTNVSVSKIDRVLNKISSHTVLRHPVLPICMNWDEFNATKDTIGKMAFIIVDHNKRNIFDINNSRKSIDINKYFRRYSKEEKDNVKYITMDLYKPYYYLMHALFRNAIIIPDRFHIVIQFRNALDKTRIALCKKSNPNYRKFKKYWKLILKNEDDLNKDKNFYSPNFRKDVTEEYIVTYLINCNDELKTTYNYYQGLLKALKNRDKSKFLSIIHHAPTTISDYAKKANKTLVDMEKYIVNSFDYDLSNGIVEGTNNVIKQVKHNACGYRKFNHLKARIMLIKGLYNPIVAN